MQIVSSQTPPEYFFTVRLRNARSDALVRHIALFRHAVRLCRQTYPFEIGAAVVLPNRTHMIWTLPLDDPDYARRWLMIKGTFARHLPGDGRRNVSRGPEAVWQQRFWEIPIGTAAERAVYERLIADAPVDEGLVRDARDWPHGSAGLFAAAQAGAQSSVASR